jgi:hypothetical protein
MLSNGKRIILPKRLVIVGLTIIYSVFIIMSFCGFFLKRSIITPTFLYSIGIVCFCIVSLLLINGWKYIFGKKAETYNSLSNREKKLYEENKNLKEENDVLRKFAGFKDMFLPKIGLAILVIIIASNLYVATLLSIEKGFGKVTPFRTSIYLSSGLLGGIIGTVIFIYLIYGKKSTEFCLNCNRIKVGEKKKNGKVIKIWKHLTSFGNFSHSLCDVCAAALMNKRLEESKIKLGELLIKKKLINHKQLVRALKVQEGLREKRIGEILIELKFISEEQLQQVVIESHV